jgi:hypothetical protein
VEEEEVLITHLIKIIYNLFVPLHLFIISIYLYYPFLFLHTLFYIIILIKKEGKKKNKRDIKKRETKSRICIKKIERAKLIESVS